MNIIFLLSCKRAFSDVLEGVVLKFFLPQLFTRSACVSTPLLSGWRSPFATIFWFRKTNINNINSMGAVSWPMGTLCGEQWRRKSLLFSQLGVWSFVIIAYACLATNVKLAQLLISENSLRVAFVVYLFVIWVYVFLVMPRRSDNLSLPLVSSL